MYVCVACRIFKRAFCKAGFPSGNFTSVQIPSDNFPKVRLGPYCSAAGCNKDRALRLGVAMGRVLWLGQTWEVATWALAHLGKYPREVATWENAFEKVLKIWLQLTYFSHYNKVFNLTLWFLV